mgnify:CR=1 FL=1
MLFSLVSGIVQLGDGFVSSIGGWVPGVDEGGDLLCEFFCLLVPQICLLEHRYWGGILLGL